MSKWLVVFTVVVMASLSTGVMAASDTSSVSQLTSSSDLMDQLNTMDNDSFSAMALRGFVCFARNGRGEHFRAYGRFPERTQQEAMRICYSRSRACFEEGCRPF